MNTKAMQRRLILDEISGLPDDYIAASDKGILLRVTSLKEFIDARNIFIYYSIEREPDTLKIARTAFDLGKTLAFPYCIDGGTMQARAVHRLSELTPATYGIPAPPDTSPLIAPDCFDLIIVPALTYDVTGHRLGHGAGYYDRYITGLPAYTVGLARERLIKGELPREPHDIAVKCVVTESRILT